MVDLRLTSVEDRPGRLLLISQDKHEFSFCRSIGPAVDLLREQAQAILDFITFMLLSNLRAHFAPLADINRFLVA